MTEMLSAALWWGKFIFATGVVVILYAVIACTVIAFVSAFAFHISESGRARKRRKPGVTEKELENWQIH